VDSVIGIDLSGMSRGTKGRTALAQLSVADPPQLLDLHLLRRGERTDVELLAWVDKRRPWVVAIDAPLSLPHSVTCKDPGCVRCEPERATYLARDIDAPAGGMPTVMIAGIAFRGIYLARQLRASGHEVIEVYPAAAYRAFGLVTKADRRDPEQVAKAIEQRVPGAKVGTADERDAVAAAIVAVAYVRGQAPSVSGEDGTIWVPPERGGEGHPRS
jgi:predicted nuclease with RNAse H fold